MKRRNFALLAVVFAATTGLPACESGGDGQTREDVPRARSTSTQGSGASKSSNPSSSSKSQKLVPHAKAPSADKRLDPGDVPSAGSKLKLSEQEWRERLTDKEFKILRESGTEPAHSGELLDEKREGVYYCAGCGAPLFSSRHKFDSKTGWPSFSRPYSTRRVGLRPDRSLGMTRTEVYCKRCDGHLGHVFPDGPKPTGKRYCINSLALDFKSVEEIQSGGSRDTRETPSSKESESKAGSSSEGEK